MFKINDKLTNENYTQGAVWCNANNARIVKEADGYYIRAVPEPSIEQLSAEKRAERDEAINAIIWRVQRYEQQKLLGIPTTDTEDTYINTLEYIQYLRDIPTSEEFPQVEILTFEGWENKYVK